MKFNIPAKENKKLERVAKLIEKDAKLEQMLKCVNVNAMERLHYADHGPVHSKIVANIALKLLRILASRGVEPNIVKDYREDGMTGDDAEVVVVLAAFLHDIGMVVHREGHDLYGVVMAQPIIEKLLVGYSDEKRVIMLAEILHAMTFHDSSAVPPLTVEGGIVRIADGLDMEEGRARIPFEEGKKDIYAISALAIEKVEIEEGGKNEKPVQIKIFMSNPAGVFQVDEVLRTKIIASGLSEYVHVTAQVTGRERSAIGKIEY